MAFHPKLFYIIFNSSPCFMMYWRVLGCSCACVNVYVCACVCMRACVVRARSKGRAHEVTAAATDQEIVPAASVGNCRENFVRFVGRDAPRTLFIGSLSPSTDIGTSGRHSPSVFGDFHTSCLPSNSSPRPLIQYTDIEFIVSTSTEFRASQHYESSTVPGYTT